MVLGVVNRGRGLAFRATVVGVVLVLLAAVAVAIVITVLVGGAAHQAVSNANCSPSGMTATVASTGGNSAKTVKDLDAEQRANAETIVGVVESEGVGEYAAVILIAVALQESGLRNLDGGDRDSLGLFQQRPSQGWGTREQILDPVKATRAALGRAGHTDNTGLDDQTALESITVAKAGQGFQRSGDPTGRWFGDDEPFARKIVASLGSGGTQMNDAAAPVSAGVDVLCGTGMVSNCPATPWSSAEAGLTPDALRVLRCIHANFPQVESFGGVGERASNSQSDHPSGRAVDAMIPDWNQQGDNGISLKVATYNALGASHTVPGGNRAKGNDGHRRRTRLAADAIMTRQLDIVGLQEFQGPQQQVFRRRAGHEYGLSAGNSDNRVAWNKSAFVKVEERALTIPYFNGNPRRMPYVLLQHRATGQKVWALSVHNPADVYGSAQRWRDEAVRREARLANDLLATGVPVIVTGDMNDRRRYFCSTIRHASLHAANGGASGRSSTCRPPKRMHIDWIMGSSQVKFAGYKVEKGGALRRASDHPLVSATASVGGTGKALGNKVAEWVKANAAALGVKYVIWDARIWSVGRQGEGWRSYEHPSGSGDPTSLHRDHVHVSVHGNSAGLEPGYGAIPAGALSPSSWTLPVAGYQLTARFNAASALWETSHTGLDFAAATGSPVRATAAGRVISVGWGGSYGKLTKIQHAGGVQSWYAHQQAQNVRVGEMVRPGQAIGAVGSTGNSTGPHLHLEVRVNGAPTDPESFLTSQGVTP